MNAAILDLQERMITIVDQVAIMAQKLDVLKQENQKLEEENSRLKVDLTLKVIDAASLQPRESSKRYRGVCIE